MRLFRSCYFKGMSTNITVQEIDDAIRTILTKGQSVSVDGVNYSKANIASLRLLRREMAGVVGRTGGKRPPFRAVKLSGMGY